MVYFQLEKELARALIVPFDRFILLDIDYRYILLYNSWDFDLDLDFFSKSNKTWNSCFLSLLILIPKKANKVLLNKRQFIELVANLANLSTFSLPIILVYPRHLFSRIFKLVAITPFHS